MHQTNNNLVEGLEKNDLKRLVTPELTIDEYKSKMGNDEDIIVISFKIIGREPAEDLVNFLEKGYDWIIDADVSAGELENGEYLVFVECDRTSKFPENMMLAVNDILNLTDQKLSEWSLHIRSSSQPLELSEENIRNNVPLTTEDYLRRYGSKEIDEMRTAAGVPVHTKAPKNDYTQSLRSLAGIL